MDTKESFALYKKGKDKWNEWANDMLIKKAELEKTGQWQINADGEGLNQATRDWMNKSRVNFAGNHFIRNVNFSEFIFPYLIKFDNTVFHGTARFNGTIFRGNAIFSEARFLSSAWFNDAIFNNNTQFNKTEFTRRASFTKTSFSGGTKFYKTKFKDSVSFIKTIFGDKKSGGKTEFYKTEFGYSASFYETQFWIVEFKLVLFKSSVRFDNALFGRDSSFIAIKGESYVSFRGAKFHLVPDFNQAHFMETPQFDDSDFSKALNHNQPESEENFSSRWRALKRLAIQGHDHERELLFFAEEIKSQRGIQDKAFPNLSNLLSNLDWFNNDNKDNNKPVWPGGARYWLGYLYEYSSDFGRSIIRPLFWLLLFGFLFQVLYLKYPIDSEPQKTISCDRSEAATYLSIRSTSPFLPATSYSENLSRSYTCLYGKNDDEKENIPNAIVFISIFQTILSSILIFLLLLALRNHFRIK